LGRVPQVLPSLVTYTYNYQLAAGGAHFDVLVIVWSLCVEEQFYLVWPWMLRYLQARRALWFCIGAIIALSTYRTGLYTLLNWRHLSDPSSASAIWIYFATDTRIGVILIGCMLALSLRDGRARAVWQWMERSRLFPPLALAAACICVVFVTGGRPSSASWRSATFGYTLGAGAVAVLIGAIVAQPASLVAGALSWQPLVSLGTISYGVYLFHAPIAWLLFWIAGSVGWLNAVGAPPFARFAIMAALVFAVTWIVASFHYRHVEQRFMSLRSRLRDSAQSAEEPAAGDAVQASIPSAVLADDAAEASP
jgi:peptidoglycan/LPS O-acetylase OafA/YrhL